MTSCFQRLTSVVDTDASQIVVWPCDKATSLSLYALCQTPGSTMTVRLFAFTPSKNLTGISLPLTFTSSATPDYMGQCSGTPDNTDWMGIMGTGLVGVHVDAITGGPWIIGVTVSQ